MKLEGRTALITGGSRGIGRAAAEAFLKEGAKVMLIAESEGELAQTAAEFSREYSSQNVSWIICDVSDEKQVNDTVRETRKRFGSIDILVNAAGIYGPIGPTLEVDGAHWRKAYEVNVFGTLYMIRAAGEHMREKGHGKIINFSGGGDGPLPNFSAYNSSKVAIVRLTETLAEEFKPLGIEVNAIAPGAVNTKFLDEAIAAGEERVGKERYQKLLKQKQEGGTPPEKTADLCVWLASSASDGLTGKFLSATWDKWSEWNPEKIKEIMASSAFTIRRTDPYRND
jgi:NAD(P)-dependent dehydrogenase (short-subunit alcohol dehydrogenase family)